MYLDLLPLAASLWPSSRGSSYLKSCLFKVFYIAFIILFLIISRSPVQDYFCVSLTFFLLILCSVSWNYNCKINCSKGSGENCVWLMPEVIHTSRRTGERTKTRPGEFGLNSVQCFTLCLNPPMQFLDCCIAVGFRYIQCLGWALLSLLCDKCLFSFLL